METRANYVLIGAFTLAVIAAAFGFVLWFQSLHTTKQRSPLRVIFEGPASGLRNGGNVNFNGIRIGEVVSVKLDNPRRVVALAMIENSASLPEAGAPTIAADAEIVPATGAVTLIALLPSVSFASTWPAVTVSPGSAITSATFKPNRSGRICCSSRGSTMPETSTMLPKQNFDAFSTVTAAPFGTASVSLAANAGQAASTSSAVAARAEARMRDEIIGELFPNCSAFRARWTPVRVNKRVN